MKAKAKTDVRTREEQKEGTRVIGKKTMEMRRMSKLKWENEGLDLLEN